MHKMIAVVCGGIGGIVCLTSSAIAATVLENPAAAECVDVQGAIASPTGTPAISFDCNVGLNQQWIISNGQVVSTLRAAKTRTATSSVCLDIKEAGTAPGTLVQAFPCNGQANQQWIVDGGLILGGQSGLCLDRSNGSGNQLSIQTCSASVTQTWDLR